MWGMSNICLWFVICSGDKCRMDMVFDRQAAIKLSGMSEKAYNRSFTSMQNGIGVKWVLKLLFHFCESVHAFWSQMVLSYMLDSCWWVKFFYFAETSLILENWQFSLGVSGSFLLFKKVYHCKFDHLLWTHGLTYFVVLIVLPMMFGSLIGHKELL